MGEKIVICVALSGAVTGKGEGKGFSPYTPITPDEVAEEAKRCYDAGATMVHIHARDSVTQNTFTGDQMDENLKCFVEMDKKIRAKCPIIINITTGGGLGQAFEQKLEPVKVVKPEMASLTSGSILLGKYSKSNDTWIMDHKDGLNYRDMVKCIEVFKEAGTKPEFEIYSFAQMNNLKIMEHALQYPIHLQFIMGMPGEVTPGKPANVFYGYQIAKDTFGEDNFTWSVCAVGQKGWACITTAACLGAQTIRTGLEDNIYLEPGIKGSNAQMVEKAVALARGVGREIASVEEARKILGVSKRK